jgi:hypothetical protein
LRRAELADVGRLARRLLNRAVETARTEDQPLRRLLLDHLGPDAALLLDNRNQLTRVLLGGEQPAGAG